MSLSRSRQFLLALGIALALLWLGPTRGLAQEGENPEIVQQGAELYEENCAVCHGTDGAGRVGATLAKDWPSIRPDLLVKATIETGVPGSPMPAWSQKNGGPLNDDEINAIVAFILSWETGGLSRITPAPTFTPFPPITPLPDVLGDPNAGAVTYAENCLVCHGENGEGRIGATLAKDWPSIRPDLRIKNTIANGVPDSPMPAWSQEKGGPLTTTEINNLVAYVLTWETQPAEVVFPSPTPGGVTSPGLGGGAAILITFLLFVLIVSVILLAQKK